MNGARKVHLVRLAGVIMFVAGAASSASAQSGDAKRGEYLFAAGGCAGCHTDEKNGGQLIAGGRELKTPFGSFFGPNITADPKFGIGSWTDAEFIRALREGRRPDGAHYFPVFPYTSFTWMTDRDMVDLKAFIFSLPKSERPSRPHEIAFPFSLRFLQFGWKALFFREGPFQPDPAKSTQVNRGAYLVEALGHCAECHSPRNILGGIPGSMRFAGDPKAPGGGKVPNITPDRDTGIGKWSDGDIDELLASGMTPDGDSVGGEMGEVVRNSTSKLTPEDRKAMLAYLRQLVPVSHKVRGGS